MARIKVSEGSFVPLAAIQALRETASSVSQMRLPPVWTDALNSESRAATAVYRLIRYPLPLRQQLRSLKVEIGAV